MARPRAFDEGQAIDAALQVFMAKGYDGASIAELTSAMGINPPSLYAAFSDKRGLFERVVDRYAGERSPLMAAALGKQTAVEVVGKLMHDYADAFTDPVWPPGCLYVQAALSCSDSAQSVREELTFRRLEIEPALQDRFERSKADGDIPSEADSGNLARYVATLLQGMAIQAASGVSRAELHALADLVQGQFSTSLAKR